MKYKTYLVMGHDTASGKLNYGVFSEPRPTTRLTTILGSVIEAEGETYEDAIKHLAAIVDAMSWGEAVRDLLPAGSLPTTPALTAMGEAVNEVE